MTRRNRVLGFGGCLLVLVIAPILGTLVGGVTGEAVAIALASLGGIALVSLVFLEIGLSEDRERARSERGAAGRWNVPSEQAEQPPEGERARAARLSRSPRPRRRRP